MGFLSSLFPGSIWIYLVGALLIGGGAAYTSYEVTAAFKDETISKLELASAKAKDIAQQGFDKKSKQIAADNYAAGASNQKAEDDLDIKFVDLGRKVPTYVNQIQETKACLTVGFIRVLSAASRGAADPATLTLASGQSDDDCADVTESAVAGWFAGPGGFADASFKNSQQLNDLIGSVAKNAATVTAPATQ